MTHPTRTRLLVLLILTLLLCLMGSPVVADDPTPGPAATVTAPPTTPTTTPTTPQPTVTLTQGELIGIVIALLAFAVGAGKILWDANQTPGGATLATVDTRITDRVDQAHSDREWVDRLERAYTLGGMQTKAAIDALTSALSAIAPMTPLKVDDAALRLLKDIQTRGPETPLASPTPFVAAPAPEVTFQPGESVTVTTEPSNAAG